MLGLGGHGLRGVVSALCGVAGGVVVVFGWVVLVAGLRMRRRGGGREGVGGEGLTLNFIYSAVLYWAISKVLRRYKICEI